MNLSLRTKESEITRIAAVLVVCFSCSYNFMSVAVYYIDLNLHCMQLVDSFGMCVDVYIS